ncbi:TIGR02117 family protein [Ornithobacterium rhinotracheale]|uniref:TIGR02117 family protein n=1 Tax=Ornithobacterium rhinotracheale TaxID=28251 RepID=UPI003FA45CD5
MKKLFQVLKKVFLSILLFFVLYFVAVLIGGNIKCNTDHHSAEEVTIYLLSNGVHTDFVVPIKNEIYDWQTLISPEDTKGGYRDYTYVAIGWGDKGFYMEIPTWSDLTPRIAARAAFGIGGTAMHTTYYKNIVPDGKETIEVKISKAEYKKLVDKIVNFFQLQNGKSIQIKTDATYDIDDAFYEAKGKYSIFYTCNTWLNQVLKEVGLPSCLWAVLSNDIMKVYQ